MRSRERIVHRGPLPDERDRPRGWYQLDDGRVAFWSGYYGQWHDHDPDHVSRLGRSVGLVLELGPAIGALTVAIALATVQGSVIGGLIVFAVLLPILWLAFSG